MPEESADRKPGTSLRELPEQLPLLRAFLLLIAAVGGYHAFNMYLDHRIQQTLSDDAFVRSLGQRLRPSVVFDENETIVNDGGAMDLLHSLDVSHPAEGEVELEVVIRPKRFLPTEPLLQALDSRYVINARRSEGLDWVFTLDAISSLVGQASASLDRPQRFRLEIIP